MQVISILVLSLLNENPKLSDEHFFVVLQDQPWHLMCRWVLMGASVTLPPAPAQPPPRAPNRAPSTIKPSVTCCTNYKTERNHHQRAVVSLIHTRWQQEHAYRKQTQRSTSTPNLSTPMPSIAMATAILFQVTVNDQVSTPSECSFLPETKHIGGLSLFTYYKQ